MLRFICHMGQSLFPEILCSCVVFNDRRCQESLFRIQSLRNLFLVEKSYGLPLVRTLQEFKSKLNECHVFCSSRLSAGTKDLQKLQENQNEYVVITTWIINIEKRLKELKDDTSGDDEALKRRRVIIVV